MSEELPEPRPESREGRERANSTTVHVDEFHFHANDIDALRRLAESNPELATTVVDQRGEFDRREHASLRPGIISTLILAGMGLAAVTFIVTKVGIIASIGAVLLVLAVDVLLRVVVTGEWSDTSWFGRGVSALVSILGGRKKRGAKQTNDDEPVAGDETSAPDDKPG